MLEEKGNTEGLKHVDIQVNYGNGESDPEDAVMSSFDGTIENVRDQSEPQEDIYLKGSGYQVIEVTWSGNGDIGYQSPWDLIVTEMATCAPEPPSLTDMEKRCVSEAIEFVLDNEAVEKSFGNPVDTDVYADYLRMIEVPIDFSFMKERLASNYYSNIQSVVADVKTIRENCLKYNGPDSELSGLAEDTLKKFVAQIDRLLAKRNASVNVTQLGRDSSDVVIDADAANNDDDGERSDDEGNETEENRDSSTPVLETPTATPRRSQRTQHNAISSLERLPPPHETPRSTPTRNRSLRSGVNDSESDDDDVHLNDDDDHDSEGDESHGSYHIHDPTRTELSSSRSDRMSRTDAGLDEDQSDLSDTDGSDSSVKSEIDSHSDEGSTEVPRQGRTSRRNTRSIALSQRGTATRSGSGMRASVTPSTAITRNGVSIRELARTSERITRSASRILSEGGSDIDVDQDESDNQNSSDAGTEEMNNIDNSSDPAPRPRRSPRASSSSATAGISVLVQPNNRDSTQRRTRSKRGGVNQTSPEHMSRPASYASDDHNDEEEENDDDGGDESDFADEIAARKQATKKRGRTGRRGKQLNVEPVDDVAVANADAAYGNSGLDQVSARTQSRSRSSSRSCKSRAPKTYQEEASDVDLDEFDEEQPEDAEDTDDNDDDDDDQDQEEEDEDGEEEEDEDDDDPDGYAEEYEDYEEPDETSHPRKRTRSRTNPEAPVAKRTRRNSTPTQRATSTRVRATAGRTQERHVGASASAKRASRRLQSMPQTNFAEQSSDIDEADAEARPAAAFSPTTPTALSQQDEWPDVGVDNIVWLSEQILNEMVSYVIGNGRQACVDNLPCWYRSLSLLRQSTEPGLLYLAHTRTHTHLHQNHYSPSFATRLNTVSSGYRKDLSYTRDGEIS